MPTSSARRFLGELAQSGLLVTFMPAPRDRELDHPSGLAIGQMLDRDHLVQVARKGPEPIFATISGAHLYGFASPDSDVDLRGAFMLPAREMLGLHPPSETTTLEAGASGSPSLSPRSSTCSTPTACCSAESTSCRRGRRQHPGAQ